MQIEAERERFAQRSVAYGVPRALQIREDEALRLGGVRGLLIECRQAEQATFDQLQVIRDGEAGVGSRLDVAAPLSVDGKNEIGGGVDMPALQFAGAKFPARDKAVKRG